MTDAELRCGCFGRALYFCLRGGRSFGKVRSRSLPLMNSLVSALRGYRLSVADLKLDIALAAATLDDLHYWTTELAAVTRELNHLNNDIRSRTT